MIMNKKLTYSLCAAAFLLTGCDYNEDNFPGYMDEAQAEQIAYYEGDFVGSYPIEGYFTLNKGNEAAEAEDRATIEAALVDMLKEMYPYCDAGSSAKVTVKIATVTPGVEDPEVSDDYTLVDADYEALGEEPASHHNFAYYMDVHAYLVQFCNMKYADATEGTIVKLTLPLRQPEGPQATLSSPQLDYAIGFDHLLLELSPALPSHFFTRGTKPAED